MLVVCMHLCAGPSITSLDPANGGTAGGYPVTITGSNFALGCVHVSAYLCVCVHVRAYVYVGVCMFVRECD